MADKRTRLSDMTKAGRKAEKPTVIGAIRDPQFVRDVLQGLQDTAYRGAGSFLGIPVDLTTMAMRPFGYSVPDEQVVGGPEWIGKKMQDAGLVSGNRNPVAELLAGLVSPDPVDAAKLGAMFIGPLAKTWDAEAAAKAARMELEGLDPRAIWAETGTWKGPEGKWRQEIPDNELKALLNMEEIYQPRKYYQSVFQKLSEEQDEVTKKFKAGSITKENALEEFGKLKNLKESARQQIDKYYLHGLGEATRIGEDIPFSQAFKHEELQNAYDDLPNISFGKQFPFESAGAYSKNRNAINLSMWNNPPESVAAHELQHAIQEREGFAKGGNPEQFMTDIEAESLRYPKVREYLTQYKDKAYEDAVQAIKTNPDLVKKAEKYAESLGEFSASAPLEMKVQDYLLSQNPSYLRLYKERQALRELKKLTPEDRYRRLAGEAEARATEARLGMTAAERRAKFPEESYDVPIRELIFR